MKTYKYPKVLYVSVENRGTQDEYLSPSKTAQEIAELGETKRIAMYVLDHEIDLTGTTQLVHRKKK